jgi:hypothetical protein
VRRQAAPAFGTHTVHAVLSIELICGLCHWRTVCGRDDAVARLRLIGLLRREPDPADELLATLLVDAASRMTCPICKEKRLLALPLDSDDVAEDADWQATVLCEICRAEIPSERLEALAGVRRCVGCQGKSEAGLAVDDTPEYCPQCGAVVELRVSRCSGITRYKRFCTGNPPCRL